MDDDALAAVLAEFGPPHDWRGDAAEIFVADCKLCEALLAEPLLPGQLRQITRNQQAWLRFWSRHHPDISIRFRCGVEAAAIEPLIEANAEVAERHLANQMEGAATWHDLS